MEAVALLILFFAYGLPLIAIWGHYHFIWAVIALLATIYGIRRGGGLGCLIWIAFIYFAFVATQAFFVFGEVLVFGSWILIILSLGSGSKNGW